MPNKPDDQYSPEETKERMAAALRGARIAGHKAMESLIKKKPKAKKATSEKADGASARK